MDYCYKEGNKFPYVIHIDEDYGILYGKINPWLREAVGAHNERWHCSATSQFGYPYAFRDLEDVMAFKLWFE